MMNVYNYDLYNGLRNSDKGIDNSPDPVSEVLLNGMTFYFLRLLVDSSAGSKVVTMKIFITFQP
ncbi:hypothetical protein ACS0TY_023106 [Phlomoides rotata]